MASRNKQRQRIYSTKQQSPGQLKPVEGKRSFPLVRATGIAVGLFVLSSGVYIYYLRSHAQRAGIEPTASQVAATYLPDNPHKSVASVASREPTRYFQRGNLTLVWDTIKPDVRETLFATSSQSNIAPSDYAGPEACQDCHRENYNHWSQHPHRWMNALANDESVRGDFSGGATIRYRDGIGKFYREGDKYRMRFDRKELSRVYEIHQTIGSRFYQYYVGKGIEGPEPKDHPYYHADHVLPFGYWLDRQAWVPVVHVHDERPDATRWDLVEKTRPPPLPEELSREEGVGRSRGVFDPADELPLKYSQACNFCHTTFPLADMFVRMPDTIGGSLTQRSVFAMSPYVAKSHPTIWDGSQPPESLSSADLQGITGKFIAFTAPEKAVTLGISCEACHLGCRHHADNKDAKPSFAPLSPQLHTHVEPVQIATGRTQANVNGACARCHVGTRPIYAGGMATWNSTEYTDAMRGSCYSQLKCIDCHEPHQAIGKKWPKSPDQDDALCLKCHQQYNVAEARQLHTHHLAGSDGDRCMNCHSPHINEGMQDVVRTHTIFSPTKPEMIEANHPNACNLCHLDKPIDWTLGHLKSWYGKTYSETEISKNFADRTGAVGIGWLKHAHEPTRLAAAAAMGRQNAQWSIPHLVNLLDDEFLMNRQFTQTALESLLGIRLDQRFGYWYYMTKDERREPIEQVQREVAKSP